MAGGPYFMISNVRIDHVGGNFGGFDSTNKEVKYYSKFNDGRVSSFPST